MKKILIVEDNEILLQMMCVFLKREGFSVVGCISGKEAIAFIQNESFDLFIVDIMLPYLNGFEVVDRIKKSQKNAQAKAMIVSALDEEEYIKDGFEIGADAILRKPVSAKELVARVTHLLKEVYV